jgi:hypothetical protein
MKRSHIILFFLTSINAYSQIEKEHFVGKRDIGTYNYQLIDIYIDTSARSLKSICIECKLIDEKNCYTVIAEKGTKRTATYTIESDDLKIYKFKYFGDKDGYVSKIELTGKDTKTVFYDLHQYVEGIPDY